MRLHRLTLITMFAFACNAPASDPKKPTAEARAWADELGMKDAPVTCSEVDSDGDGYVSCTVKNGADLHSIQCLASIDSNGCNQPARGCKVTPIVVKGQ